MDLCAVSINLPLSLLAEMAIFVKVVEAGNFSEAARQLGTSPSAVSRSIARLEKALAIRLLQRTTRKLRLSDGGEQVYKRCRDVVGAAQSVQGMGGGTSGSCWLGACAWALPWAMTAAPATSRA